MLDMPVQHATTDADIARVYPVMKELRPHIATPKSSSPASAARNRTTATG